MKLIPPCYKLTKLFLVPTLFRNLYKLHVAQKGTRFMLMFLAYLQFCVLETGLGGNRF
jgi:hypothetical protein